MELVILTSKLGFHKEILNESHPSVPGTVAVEKEHESHQSRSTAVCIHRGQHLGAVTGT